MKAITHFFKTYKVLFIAGACMAGMYFVMRLLNLMHLPLFTDEAIYTRWSQIARYDPNWRFISLTDGKQPSFIWANMIMLHLIKDPLLSGRIVSVFAGFGTMIGMFFLGRELFKSDRIGILSALLFLLYPMTLVYNRMALYESTVTFFTIWVFYLQILLVRRVKLDVALLLGIILGMGVLTKTNLFLCMPLLLVSLLLFDFKQKDWPLRLLKWFWFAILSVVIAYAMYSILRLSPFYHIINEKNTIFIYPIHDWIHHPFTYLIGNLRGLFNWFWIYMSLPWLVLLCLPFIKEQKTFAEYLTVTFRFIAPLGGILVLLAVIGTLTHQKDFYPETLPWAYLLYIGALALYAFFHNKSELGEKVLILAWFLEPFLYLAFFGRTLYPRYILNMTVPLLVLIAYALVSLSSYLKQSWAMILLFALAFAFPVYSDFMIISDFARAPLPGSDLEQYSNGWPAGGGLTETISYLSSQAAHQKIYVASEGTFGSLPTYAVEIYLGDNKNVEKEGIWPMPTQIPEDLIKRARTTPVYVIVNQSQLGDPTFPSQWPMTQIAQYQKGVGNVYLRLFQVNTPH